MAKEEPSKELSRLKGGGFWDKLGKALFLDNKPKEPRIEIVKEETRQHSDEVDLTKEFPDYREPMIEIIEDCQIEPLIEIINKDVEAVASDGVLDITDINLLIERYGTELAPKVIISAESNRKAANDFCKEVRSKFSEILPGSKSVVREDNDLEYGVIDGLLNKWGIPAIIVRRGENREGAAGHYTLGLKQPEQGPDGEWRILIYDPMHQGEEWLNLPPDWATNYSRGVQVLPNSYVKYEQPYDLTVQGDKEFAESADIVRAKRTQIQHDLYNCGLMCVMMAAIRAGFKEESNTFKFEGKDIMEKDTGAKIYLREEIIKRQS